MCTILPWICTFKHHETEFEVSAVILDPMHITTWKSHLRKRLSFINLESTMPGVTFHTCLPTSNSQLTYYLPNIHIWDPALVSFGIFRFLPTLSTWIPPVLLGVGMIQVIYNIIEGRLPVTGFLLVNFLVRVDCKPSFSLIYALSKFILRETEQLQYVPLRRTWEYAFVPNPYHPACTSGRQFSSSQVLWPQC